MKKTIALIAGLALSCSAAGMNAFAADESTTEGSPLKANILVTISDGNGLAVPQADVLVTDINGDEHISIDEALCAAHEQFYEGGAAAGYASSEKEGYFGASIDKLWGIENGGSYGFYVNNAAAWSLSDELKDNDYLDAFVYSDTKTFADTYCFFDKRENLGSEEGDMLTLTLSKMVWGADGTTTSTPVAGAEITIDGKGTGVLTDEEGKATFELTKDTGESKKAVISAVSATETLVPPVCLADINNKEEETEPETTTAAAETTTESSTTSIASPTANESETDASTTTSTAASAGAVNNSDSDSPKTGDAGTGAAAAVLGCTVLAAFALKRKDV